jgi:signal transduction histidine kinase
LGLTIVYAIVKKHEGHIEAQSIPGKGSTFHVYLPASQTPPTGAPETAST